MEYKLIRKIWPNAHPECKPILRKGYAKKKIKEKENKEGHLPRVLPNVQDAKEVH
jgi:hypothetical protein